jgi:hypothetical protein
LQLLDAIVSRRVAGRLERYEPCRTKRGVGPKRAIPTHFSGVAGLPRWEDAVHLVPRQDAMFDGLRSPLSKISPSDESVN